MEYKCVYAIYRGNAPSGDFLPGWGYYLQIAHAEGTIAIRHPKEDKVWKTVSAADFAAEWKVVRRR